MMQVLHVIRHGESEYNAATSLGMDFSDPQIFNPKLTEKGRRQVCHYLQSQLILQRPLSKSAEFKYSQLTTQHFHLFLKPLSG